MINEKKIEKATQRYCNVTDANKNEASLLSEGFKEGIHWFKKSLWHDASEKPHKYATILVVGEEERYPAGGSGVEVLLTYNLLSEYYDWEEEKEDMNIVKWLYLDDIVVEEGGEEYPRNKNNYVKQPFEEKVEESQKPKEIDWEQRRYEIAKEMLSTMYLDEGQESRKGNHNIDFEFKDMNSCASEAVRWADTLIEELKKTSK